MIDIKIKIDLVDYDDVIYPISETIIENFGDSQEFIHVLTDIKKHLLNQWDKEILVQLLCFVYGMLESNIDSIFNAILNDDYPLTIEKQFIAIDLQTLEIMNGDNTIITISKGAEQ